MSPSDLRVAALYFDGKTAAGKPVTLAFADGELLLLDGDGAARWPMAAVRVSERLGSTPRLLTCAGAGHCEVSDHAALELLLAQAGARRSWLDGLQHSIGWALAALVLAVVAFAAAYRYLLPWGAETLAMRTPDIVLQKMGSSTLDAFDEYLLKPSKLDAARQQELSDAFARLAPLPGARSHYRIVFRSSPEMGANAFALPDGTIVMLDQLVDLTKDDNEIIAVLAHERGHVERRHAMRMVLQSSVVGLVLAWYVGDVSGLLATAPAVLMQAKYSRDMEREADEYAERTVQLNGLSPCLLATILGKLETAHLAKRAQQQPEAEQGKDSHALDYLSSHPATRERMSLLCPAGASQ